MEEMKQLLDGCHVFFSLKKRVRVLSSLDVKMGHNSVSHTVYQ